MSKPEKQPLEAYDADAPSFLKIALLFVLLVGAFFAGFILRVPVP